MSRLVHGAIAGFCATMAMTAAMRALHRQLPWEDRYPLPPREITGSVLKRSPSKTATNTALAHFGFGALAGAIYGALPRQGNGLLYGPVVWAASYLGWIPAVGILAPATRHPAERNMLMLAVHLVWGACLAAGLKELEAASRTIFASGPYEDRVDSGAKGSMRIRDLGSERN